MITNRVFDDARDKNVANFIVDGKAADGKLYYDLTATTPVQVTQADVEDAFKKGRLIVSTSAGLFQALAVVGNKVLTASMAGSPTAAITGTEWEAKDTPVG